MECAPRWQRISGELQRGFLTHNNGTGRHIPDNEGFSCANGGYSGETNNLSLGTCTGPYQWQIQFSESD